MIRFTDRASAGAHKKTKDGYLIATARVARTGVQEYYAGELGDAAAHLPADKVVRVYRHKDEVFSDSTTNSITRVPVTVDHPPVMVDADNHGQYSVGDVGDAWAADGDWIVVNPMIKDADAVKKAQTTHREISMGYTANIVPARDGVDADFEMVDISMNHLALVPRGRAGSEARIGDSGSWGASPVKIEDKKMTVELKTVVLGDKAVQVDAKDADTVAAILRDHAAVVADKDKEIGELTVKLADAESKVLTDEALKELVDAKVKADTERAAVKAVIGDKADKMTDAQIEGAYLALGDAVKVDDSVRQAIGDKKQKVDDAAESEARILAAQRKFLNLEAK